MYKDGVTKQEIDDATAGINAAVNKILVGEFDAIGMPFPKDDVAALLRKMDEVFDYAAQVTSPKVMSVTLTTYARVVAHALRLAVEAKQNGD